MNGSTGCIKGKNELEKLRKLDFSIIDTILYLDVYPDCKEALKYYHALLAERQQLVHKLAEEYDMPITNFDNLNDTSWVWIDNPWPWEITAE